MQSQPYSTGFAPAGYFSNQQYPPSYPQQPPSSYQPSPHAVPQQQSYQPRVSPNQADATNGLVHQFSHQNLGGNTRTNNYSNRQQGGSQRPRTAGATGQQASYSYLNAPMPSQHSQHFNRPEFEVPPERNYDKYGSVAQMNQKKTSSMAENFFRDSVKRARDRNVRFVYPSAGDAHS
jgi:protein-serine/threonine kinase